VSKNPRRPIRIRSGPIRLILDTLGLACISAAGFAALLWPGFWLGLAVTGVLLLILSWGIKCRWWAD
jgi:hypothetical protein